MLNTEFMTCGGESVDMPSAAADRSVMTCHRGSAQNPKQVPGPQFHIIKMRRFFWLVYLLRPVKNMSDFALDLKRVH